MKRREFLKTTGAAAAFLATGCERTESMTEEETLDSFGIQLYTIRDLMSESVRDTLTLVADAGYREVEFAGYFGHEPTEVRAMLDELGLTSPSVHVSLEALNDDAEAHFAMAREVGQKHIVVPWIGEQFRTLDGYREVCAQLNAAGTRARDAGFTLAYHNHDFEFFETDGTVPYDLMLSELDPDLVKMQLDLYWVFVGGYSAVDYLAADPARYVSCHVKDGDGTEQSIVGAGDVDLAAAFRAGSFEHYFVENDNPEDAETFVRESAAYLKQLTF